MKNMKNWIAMLKAEAAKLESLAREYREMSDEAIKEPIKKLINK